MTYQFNVNHDIEVRYRSYLTGNYEVADYKFLSQAVAYYLDLINKTDPSKPLAIGYGGLSLLAVAFSMALKKTRYDYVTIYQTGDFTYPLDKNFYSKLFLLGRFADAAIEKIQSEIDHNNTLITESAVHEQNIKNYHRQEDLTFDFSNDRKMYMAFKSEVSLLYNTDKVEGSSIRAAMNSYFIEDDYCVMTRGFQHIGVATLSIFPAFFKTKKISICTFFDDNEWGNEVHLATNLHVPYDVIKEKLPLPKKLRMLTTGGYNFNSECVDYVKSQCDIEKIVDCFGTAICPPPLAVREITSGNSIVPFTWVNDYIKPNSKAGQLEFVSTESHTFSEGMRGFIDGNILTFDQINLDGDKFYFWGSNKKFIRVADSRRDVGDFSEVFKQHSGIEKFEVHFEVIDGVENPVIIVDAKDFESATHTSNQLRIEAKIKTL